MDRLYRVPDDEATLTRVWLGDGVGEPPGWDRVTGREYWWAQFTRDRLSYLDLLIGFALAALLMLFMEIH